MTTKWPAEVTVVRSGDVIDGEFQVDGEPGCTLGWAGLEFFGNMEHYDHAARNDEFCKAYMACARSDSAHGNRYDDPADVNNNVRNPTRALLHNAAMAYLGYTENQSRPALALARKAGAKL